MLGERGGERWVPSADLAVVDDGAAVYVLDLTTLEHDGVPRSITGSGAEVWRRLDGATLGSIVADLATDFAADPSVVAVDVLAFVDELVMLGILVPDGHDLRLDLTEP